MSEPLVNVDKILASLKDFQQASADYIFQRMYLDDPPARRFLLADEVGLGKTMVAKGVVAKAIDHLRDTVPRIDVLYICSNQDIARQNISRLNVTGKDDYSIASRITLLPTLVKGLKSSPLNFITFTPSTSFSLHANLGAAKERVLLFMMLEEVWGLRGTKPINVLQGYAGVDSFRERLKEFRKSSEIDETLWGQFGEALNARCTREKADGKADLRSRFEALCELFGYAGKKVSSEGQRERTAVVGELRALLASSCLEALEPDLIVLDEFQRFRDLLDGNDEASKLAQNLFDYGDARVLLLSATPYKMYTLESEAETDDHYVDFLRTFRFLSGDAEAAKALEGLLADFRHVLLTHDGAQSGRVGEIKAEIERRLRAVMSRTERLAADPGRSGMLTQVAMPPSPVSVGDLQSYLGLQAVADHLEQGDALEYWKSAPYALNFMDDYQLKAAFNDAADRGLPEEVGAALTASKGLFLNWKAVEKYEEIDPGNARLRGLIADTIGRGTWRTLWMPPALPYYTPRAPFDNPNLMGFTKRLVFSSWKVVPKAIAGLLSLEAERRMMRSCYADALNTPVDHKRRKPLLRFSKSDGRLTGLPLLTLVYPSSALADLCDPLHIAASPEYWSRPPDASLVLDVAKLRIERALAALSAFRQARADGPVDERWYWAAPLLLDLAADKKTTEALWNLDAFSDLWCGEDEAGQEDEGTEEDDSSAVSEHVSVARNLIFKTPDLGRPPSDLSLVLAHAGIAAPAIVSHRTLRRIAQSGDPDALTEICHQAAAMGRKFLSLFNQPESTAVIRGLNPEEPFWRRVLEYCFAGNLQAVLDEYAHVLLHSEGLTGKPGIEAADGVAEAIQAALSLRAARVSADEIEPGLPGKKWTRTPHNLRMRFALRFGDEKSEDDSRTRRAQVQMTFNSPFWPFVLVTTSVGQEGLDFHHYCHAVVHWNLPSNPVDLEQREGRVHRFKGHAIRKNLASQHADAAFASPQKDPWRVMFEEATAHRPAGKGDLFPFWILPVEGGAQIERYVPATALSRDLARLAALRRSLAVYRMVFGQPRQEELLDILRDRVPPEELEKLANDLRIDLTPPSRSSLVSPPQEQKTSS